MSLIFEQSSSDIPLSVFDEKEFIVWLVDQPESTKKWLASTNFSGEGEALLPDDNGNLAQVIVVIKEADHYFSCGHLIRTLPAASYTLRASSQYVEAIAFGWQIGTYQFTRYKDSSELTSTLSIDDQALVERVSNAVSATKLVRDLVNTPPNDMMPEHLAQVSETLASAYGASIQQIVGDDLLKHNYPTIHAVGRASIHKPRLIDMHWGNDKHPKVTLVGKGVCFDSGGLDIKPKDGMRFMKKDMGGAAHVLGLAQLIMASGLPIRLRVLIPAVENAVAHNALRPGDVVVTRKGISVEIDNTDAEGRLVLCDALDEANNDNPDLLIDFATLTGAMRIALGTELPGFFSTNDNIANDLMRLGNANNDPVWRMPLYQPYKALLNSDVADMTNCSVKPQGGAIVAALYLQDFVAEQTNWLHFDVMAWNTRNLVGRPIGGEAFGIRTVFDYLQSKYAG